MVKPLTIIIPAMDHHSKSCSLGGFNGEEDYD